jgi:rhamnopyranosyl-N-acetylglucosaminyl-diphospho-decaprenol beta-1,3/1,4-galactofuranosyltransferase
MRGSITALVVTHNRKTLLCQCLGALAEQTRRPDRILVVDNASSDGTQSALRETGWLDRPEVEWLGLNENTGGAGGFSAGLRYAVETGADWVWMMDDDALPEPDALATLVARPLDATNLYASLAVDGNRLAWPMEPANGRLRGGILYSQDLPEEVNVHFAPFLGLLVSAQTVERIGTPDAGFFIAADDVEYCLRAQKQGSRVVLVRGSRVGHPASQSRSISVFGKRVTMLQLTPWKRYYDVRNRLLVAKVYHGAALYYATIPGTLVRALMAMLDTHDRSQQLKAVAAGTVDGLLGRKGRRHDLWKLS